MEIPARLRHSYEHVAAPRGLSIHQRLLLLVMAAALPALLFSLLQARTASRVERDNAEQAALQLARRIASHVDDHVSTVDALLVALTRAVRPDAAGAAHNDSVLASVSRDLGPRYLTLSVADAEGRVVGLSGGMVSRGSGFNVRDRKYFREALRTRGLGIGEPMIGRISGEYTLALGRAILAPDGHVMGVVTASTGLSRLQSLLLPADLPDQAVVTLLDANGVVLARTRDADKWVGRSINGIASEDHDPLRREGVSELRGLDGTTRLSGYSTAGKVPWSVYVGIPSSIALARVRDEERQAVWLFAGSLTLSLFLAWLLARGIANPIRALTADAEAFAAGDLRHRSRVTEHGEIGTLAATFNRMIGSLERRGDELGASERRYRALFDTMPLPMWVYDVETLRFLAVNDAALARYGWTRAEFLGMSVIDIRPPSDVPAFREHNVPDVAIRRHGFAVHHVTRDGELLHVEISSDDLQYSEKRARLVVANDVTARHRTEDALRASQEQLRQSQKMEAIGSLAGGIAHDFNNLLTAILGYCDLALDELAPESGAGSDVLEIRRAALRAAELTRQLLAFSRRQVLKPETFRLGRAVSPMEKILRRLISENIELQLVVAPDTPHVRADPTQLEQVILNLALNARDAMPRGGRLSVRTAARTLTEPRSMPGSTLPAGRYAVLEVSDTGSGIAADARDRLFEPFFTTKARGQGTGLGLATVYGIVQQSGGGIEVSSEAGQGATFTLYFPVAERGVADEAEDLPPVSLPRAVPTPAFPGATVLLAEDDDAVRAIACEVLERAGYRVLAARDGHDALRRAADYDGHIDLLLTDVIMPGMNGRELADQLAVVRPGLRVLFASGYSDNVLLDQGALAPGVQLVDKPFTAAVLSAKVAEVLGRVSSSSPLGALHG